MLSRTIKSIRGRVGPVGLALLAAALTAVAFAAVSVAKDSGSGDHGDRNGRAEAHGPGGPPPLQELSDEDKQAMEEFRQCMSDQGVDLPEPPQPGEEPSAQDRPEPPSEAERAKMDDAFKACEDKLPEGAHGMPGGPGCGPPPGGHGGPGGPGGQQGTAPGSSGSGSGQNEQQGYSLPAPQGSAS